MDGKMLARFGAVVFIAIAIAIAITATAIDMTRKDEPSALPLASAFQPPARNPAQLPVARRGGGKRRRLPRRLG